VGDHAGILGAVVFEIILEEEESIFGRAPAGAEKIERLRQKKCNTAGLSVCLTRRTRPFFFSSFRLKQMGFLGKGSLQVQGRYWGDGVRVPLIKASV
jgi:hypothetical protein